MQVETEATAICEQPDRMPPGLGRRLSVLHLVLSISETNAPYNDHCLPVRKVRDISICTYFRPSLVPPEEITLFAGDDTLFGFLRALRKALKARRYDIIHTDMQHVAFLFILWNALTGWRLMARTVHTIHSSYPIYKPRNKLLLIPVFALFRRVVCCSYSSRDCVPRYLKWLAGSRLRAVENCLDLERLDRAIARHPRQCRGRVFSVVSVGRLIKGKDPLTVLRAFQQAADPACQLVFIGMGEYGEILMREREALGVGTQVELTGLIPREQVYERLSQADMFISASVGEGLPLSVLQAMACSCPVILSDIGPHREITMGAPFIPLVPIHDAAGFAREIKRFREMPPEARARVGELCREIVEKRFQLATMHEGYGALYAELIGARE
jgi:glycosyltransferase involved in cell wall biosynthesis